MDNKRLKPEKENAVKSRLSKETGTSVDTIKKNIETITELEKKELMGRSAAEQIAGKVTAVAGSALFIVLHILFFGGWILVNTEVIPGIMPFDPFPFSFLTLVVSLEAIFLTLLVLMSQNRMAKEADKRAHLDLQINMLDEQETTTILKMVLKISEHLGLVEDMDETIKELAEETDVNRVAENLDNKNSV